MRNRRRTLLIVLALLVLAQFVPVTRDNPPERGAPPASPEVIAVLRRACFDCHSNETVWPWYSRIAPMSWLIEHDVHDAREQMNLSEWARYSPAERTKRQEKAIAEVEKGGMPLWYYLPLHPPARLTPADKAILETWR